MLYALLAFTAILIIHFIAPKSEKLVKAAGLLLILNKGIEIIYGLLNGNFYKIPVELSTITYFALPLSLFTNNKSLRKVFAFMGLISGIGFYLAFIVTGNTFLTINGLYNTIQGFINHSILFYISLYLLKEQPVINIKVKIWLSSLLLLIYMIIMLNIVDYSNSSIFIRELITGSFILPKLANFGLIRYVLYYGSLIIIYHVWILLFIKLNALNYHKDIILEDITPVKI